MFNNLIESSSHKSELKRRGSYFLFTTATYLALFTVAGVISIYAYDARLEEPASEIVMLSPLDYQPPAPVVFRPTSPPPRGTTTAPNEAIRRVAMASVNQPQIAPEAISAKPNTSLPVPENGIYRLGNHDADPVGLAGSGRQNGSGDGVTGGTGNLVVEVGTPPAPPIKKPVPRIISKGVITGDAISLPKPPYPPMAKQMKIQGPVSVQVLIDESGRVISAKAVSGSAALVHAAQQAALGARFSPTKLGDQPVKVSGVITYNFVLQ